MDSSSKIFIAGHNGLVGSALTRKLKEKGFNNLLLKNRSELYLTIQHAVEAFFADEKPDNVAADWRGNARIRRDRHEGRSAKYIISVCRENHAYRHPDHTIISWGGELKAGVLPRS